MARSPDPIAVPAIGVATVSYGSEAELAPFLATLPGASTVPVLAVVSDNQPDAPHSTVREICANTGAHYLPMSGNLGYGKAMNAAVAAMPPSVRWVLISNPDVRIGAGAIDELVSAAEQDSRIGAVGPAVLGKDGSVYPSARAIPSLRTGVGHALFVNLWAENPWTTAYRRDSEAALVTRDAGWLSGSCLLVRRSLFDELGGFDPRYFMYFEDVDLGNRIGKAGYRNLYWPTASVVHSGAHSTTSESEAMTRAHHTSARLFLSTKYRGPILWPVRVALTIALAARSFLVRRGLKKTANQPKGENAQL